MSSPALRVPGVYVQEQRARAARSLPTGVPVFVGLLDASAPLPAGTAMNADSYGPVPLYHKTEFLGGAAAFLGHAIEGFFDNGGSYCYVVAIKVNPATGSAAAERLIAALNLTSALGDVDLIAVPDAHALLDDTLAIEVQRAMLDHCTSSGTRVAVLDALRGKSAQALIENQVNALGLPATGPVNAALYHPWVRTIASGSQFVPPCGQMCGVISRTDAAAGVFKAPANAEVQDATDLDADLDADSLGALNDAGVNCIRALPARGIRVWGARTLSRDPAWTFLNVRRLVLTVLRWIDLNMAWAAFEPNVPALWARIERELTTYLLALWRAGALQGDTAGDAFFVRCDAELNPVETREIGQVVTQIGLAPSSPAELIVVTVQHRAGTTELS
ncbi:MAG TPA: phage tail sheath subtilisin-like domain-containing protein [Steroidobacteraceae bacterium]|jgi:phage tail sheath protein FI|nr:phage tail sheath subtilisin-like domain-containing protein [Steroidobacteraceae bacterium]